jgi:hypothetical protein
VANPCLDAVLHELRAAGVSYAVTRGKRWHVTAAELGQRAIIVAVSVFAACCASATVNEKPPGPEAGRLIQNRAELGIR